MLFLLIKVSPLIFNIQDSKGKTMNRNKTILIALLVYFSVIKAASAEHHEMKVGDFTVIAIQDTTSEMNSGLIVNGNPDIIKKNMPEGKGLSSNNVFIIRTGKQTVLVDAGVSGKVLEKLKKAGVSPVDVDLILITHAHFDHVNGLINKDQAVFPKAKVLFSTEEKAAFEDTVLDKLTPELKAPLLKANQILKVYGKRAGAFKYGDAIVDGIIAVDISGHTPGHSGFMIESGGQKLLIAGDFLHIAAIQFAYPEYSLVYDKDPQKAATVRKSTLSKLAKENIPVAGIHIPFPGIGYVRTGENGFVFTAIE